MTVTDEGMEELLQHSLLAENPRNAVLSKNFIVNCNRFFRDILRPNITLEIKPCVKLK